MKLIIVESPTKSKTLQTFLGKDYTVESSFGHIRDLPKGKLGVDVEDTFEPEYVIPTKQRKQVNILKKEAAKADEVILATDEDREGEAIAYHLQEALGLKDSKRIVFHEITKPAIEEALKNPRKLDMDLVDAQQARRVLDRLVGYKLSPFLWKKVVRGLSAGRVQSVAVRMIMKREEEINAFKPDEYWSIDAHLKSDKAEFEAHLAKKDNKTIQKLGIKTKKEADAILKDLADSSFEVTGVEKKEVKRNPLPPFTTSTLQQEASRKMHFSAKQTMAIAQKLYETGLITYHRTDSLNLSQLAIGAAKKHITSAYGAPYSNTRTFKTKSRGAQEAHEAIRPSYPDKTPDSTKLSGQHLKLYELIWGRFMASQMSPAVFDSTALDIEASNYTFRATGQILKFDGFLKVYPIKFEEAELPDVKKGEVLDLLKLIPEQHFTQPPPRYTDASLIKALEEQGIGRPSTYAPTLSTIQDRGYVEKNDQRRFAPTELGTKVDTLLVEHFPKIVDFSFTAKMEEQLDDVADGDQEWIPMIKEFYGPFNENLEKKYEEVTKENLIEEVPDKECPECHAPMVIRLGRYGKFYACSKFPECKHTENIQQEKDDLDIPCPSCKEGKIVTKRTKRGKNFYGCNRYPECDHAVWDKPTGEHCKECKALLVEKSKKVLCSNKECPKSK